VSGINTTLRIFAPLSWKRSSNLRWLILAAVFAAVFAFLSPHAAAQGCAMCYQSAAASGEQGRAALRHGVLILLVPAASLFLGILALIYRRNTPRR